MKSLARNASLAVVAIVKVLAHDHDTYVMYYAGAIRLSHKGFFACWTDCPCMPEEDLTLRRMEEGRLRQGDNAAVNVKQPSRNGLPHELTP